MKGRSNRLDRETSHQDNKPPAASEAFIVRRDGDIGGWFDRSISTMTCTRQSSEGIKGQQVNLTQTKREYRNDNMSKC